MSGYFFFEPSLVALILVARVYSFCSPIWFYLCFQNFCFLFFLFFLLYSKDSATLVRSRARVFSLADFVFLVLDSLGRDSLVVIPLVNTFKIIIIELEGRWPLEQWISESRTIILDFKFALAFALTAFYIISSKLTDSQSCYSISNFVGKTQASI